MILNILAGLGIIFGVLFILKWVLAILALIFFSIFYAVTGRWKEFCDRMENDKTFLTFDKDTGKFIW